MSSYKSKSVLNKQKVWLRGKANNRKCPSKSKINANQVEEIEQYEVTQNDIIENSETNNKWTDQTNPTWKEISGIMNKLNLFITFTMLLVQTFVILCLVFRVF